MKAIRFQGYGGPEVLVLEEIPVPEIHEHVYPLAEVAQAQRDLESRKTTGRLVVEIS
jgi:NADPH:quinone reductase-like Zn-dependent oxidoreductase